MLDFDDFATETPPPPPQSVLYLEDDPAMAEMMKDCLRSAGMQVHHLPALPDGGVSQLLESGVPDYVLLDIRLPGQDGYQICKSLREHAVLAATPIVFISGLQADDDLLRAYEVGADDYLVKPLRLQELVAKLPKLRQQKQLTCELTQRSEFAQRMAFDAMKTSSELGEILRFHEVIHSVKDLAELGKRAAEVMVSLGVHTTVMFFVDGDVVVRDDGQPVVMEADAIRSARERGRLYSWKRYSFFNYDLFSVMVRDMPVDDEVRYGVLKDQLCLLLNGLDARIRAMRVEQSNDQRRKHITIVAKTVAGIVMDMEKSNIALSEEFEKVMLDMESNISADLVQFNLLDQEEQVLINHVRTALKRASDILEGSLSAERQHKQIMTQLLTTLSGRKD